MSDDRVPTTTEEVVDLAVEIFQRQVAEGAEKIREGLAIWSHVEEHTKRWLPELPSLLKAQGQQIVVSVGVVVEGSEDAGKRMKGDALPPVEVIKGGLKVVGS
jgi:hypothetical protein